MQQGIHMSHRANQVPIEQQNKTANDFIRDLEQNGDSRQLNNFLDKQQKSQENKNQVEPVRHKRSNSKLRIH